jgi:two-component system nitrate/nitrite response regulator NarL
MAVRILVADDHEIVLEGIRTLVGRAGREWEICGEARNGKEAVSMIKTLRPDVAILDITMPLMSGLQAAKEVTGMNTGCRLLMFTMHESSRLGSEVREAGAQGYVLKSQASRDLIRAVDQLVAGNTFFGAPPEPSKGEKKGDQSRGPLFCRAFAFA